MMSLADEGLASDLQEIIDDLPATFVWQDGSPAGVIITNATVSQLLLEQVNRDVGHYADRNLQIAAQKTDFPTQPKVGQAIAVTLPAELSGSYRINTFTIGEDEVSYNFVLERI